MNRRKFLTNSSLLVASSVLVPNSVLANASGINIKKDVRKFAIANSYAIKYENQATNLWLPVPLTSEYQELLDIKYSGNYNEANIVQNPYDTKVLHVKWNEDNTNKRELKVAFEVVAQSRTTSFKSAKNSTNYPKDVAVFLAPTSHIPVDSKIEAFVAPIVKGAATPLQKVKAIYEWTVQNMYRDTNVIGCGIGDAKRAIEEKIFGGKCTDISSVFVALLRNANIPAREVFGIRAGKSAISKAFGGANESGFADITASQHCRAEFYIDGIGWIPADPADVTKARLAEKLEKGSKRLQEIQEYQFGSWEMNWVAFNYARDFILEPKPEQYPLNMLGYPYGENGEDVLDYYQPKSFAYMYSSQEKI